jgi:hypothetical protein
MEGGLFEGKPQNALEVFSDERERTHKKTSNLLRRTTVISE